MVIPHVARRWSSTLLHRSCVPHRKCDGYHLPPMLPSMVISDVVDRSCSLSTLLVHRTACLHLTCVSACTVPRGGLVETSLGWIRFAWDLTEQSPSIEISEWKGWRSHRISSKSIRVSDTKHRTMAETAAVGPPETSNLPPMASILKSLLAGGIAGGVYVRERMLKHV